MFFLPTYPIFQNHVIGTTHIFCFGLKYNIIVAFQIRKEYDLIIEVC